MQKAALVSWAGFWNRLSNDGVRLAFFGFILFCGIWIPQTRTFAQAPQLLTPGTSLADSRLAAPRTVDSEQPFHTVRSAEEWTARRDAIRRRIAVSAGLWPMPKKAPLKPVIHGRIDKGDYTIEKVFFESFPGHFVTGNLYRPVRPQASESQQLPGVLCPHGHWKNGRFMDSGEAVGHQQIKEGAEHFVNGGRSPLQARCVGLARLGCVVFHYDMLGCGDSIQFSSHRQGPHASLDGRELGSWGFDNFEATARLQGSFGLQTFNSICALDFLSSLAGVDPKRIGVTGASGGGTQTMMLMALDDRVTAAFPCVMVSTAMQGGCTCENGHYLRIGQGNIDIAAMAAPRPLGLTTADDWTKELESKGYPDLVALYRMLGVSDRLEAHFDNQFKHNYNAVARSHCYRFLDRHFDLRQAAPGDEADFDLLPPEAITVWDTTHPLPIGTTTGDDHQRQVCRVWTADADQEILPLLSPHDERTLARTRELLGGASAVMFGRTIPSATEVAFESSKPAAGVAVGLVIYKPHGERIPVVVLRPTAWNGGVVIWPHPQGKNGLFTKPTTGGKPDRGAVGSSIGQPTAAVRLLLDRGLTVVAADLCGQGESCVDGLPLVENPQACYPEPPESDADRWKLSPVYFYGYNDSLYSRRVHDLLTLVAFVRSDQEHPATSVSLVGQVGAGHWVAGALAAAQTWSTASPGRGGIDSAVIETGGFRFEKLPSVRHADFLPGAVKYGDLPGLLALAAPVRLFIDDPDPEVAKNLAACYRAAGCEHMLQVSKQGGVSNGPPESPPAWIDCVYVPSQRAQKKD